MHLGPLVAAQQGLDSSPLTGHPQEERKGVDTAAATKYGRV